VIERSKALAQTVYEGMFILDAGKYGRDPEGVSGQIPRMIRDNGGEVLVSRLWEERRLAYPIKGHRRGTYWLTYFRIEGSRVRELNRKCQLSDTILRHLFLKIDPRLVDALVQHAAAGQPLPTGVQAVELEIAEDDEDLVEEDAEQTEPEE